MNPCFRLTAPLLLTLLCGCSTAPRLSVPAVPPDEPPVPIIHLRGTGRELGEQMGSQLGREITSLYAKYFGQYFQSDMERNMALIAAGMFESRIGPEYLAEVKALAAKTGLDERQVMLAQCFLDLSAMTACSTITLPGGASSDRVARFGRNLDFPGFDIADKSSVLLVYHPKDRFSFVSVAWPGMMGVLSGMNEHGLTLANMEVDRPQRPPMAMPYSLLYRSILERCRTVDEAIGLLRSIPRQTANNLMLMDAAGGRAVVEITPDAVTVRRASDSAALISTNHHRLADLDTPGRCARFDYLHDTAARQFGSVSRTDIQAMLAHVAQGEMTLQSMVFEPSNRVMYLAVGANAPTRGYHRIDLNRLFQ
jgi:isopenicillin-N N-acyltransferase-like protein